MSLQDNIRQLTRQLYPKGRAFNFPFSGIMDRLHKALSITEAQAYTDGLSILSAILPDNSDFTVADAADWERRLAIAADSSVSLATRKLAIKRKINHPGTAPYRQNYKYLEAQLQAAGFNVYVYENKFSSSPPGSYITMTPEQIIGSIPAGAAFHATTLQHGQVNHGGLYNKKIANHIDAARDASFTVGSSYRSTFFISGPTLTTFASVDAAREKEFRQLILRVKPLQAVGFLFVNYV